MICNKCKTRNPIGNKFCKECGVALPLDANPLVLEEANRVEQERKQEQVAALLTQGFALSEANQVEKALPLVQEAIALMPHSTAAYSLLATVYERLDEPQKAINAMKRVVELNPESTADRAKLEMMQRGVHVLPKTTTNTKATIPSPPPKKNSSALPLSLACMTGALVITGAVFLMNSRSNTLLAVKTNNSSPLSSSVQSPVRVATNITPTSSHITPTSSNIGSPGAVRLAPQNTTNLEPPPGRSDPFSPLTPLVATPSPAGNNNAPTLPSPDKNNANNANNSNNANNAKNRTRLYRGTQATGFSAKSNKNSEEPPSVVILPTSAALPNPESKENTSSTSMGTVHRPSSPDITSSASSLPKKDEKQKEEKKDEGYIRIQVRSMTAQEREKERERLRRQREKEKGQGDEMGQEEKSDQEEKPSGE